VHSEPSSATISAAGDWGYTLGSMTVTAGGNTRDAHYMRLWHRAPDGTWKLFLDTFALMPPPAPSAE
jgi:ketosteroid isomerase-like protein